MSEFFLAIPTVMRHEGGYVNNPNDPGGATKYGISLRWLKSQGLHGDVNGDLVVDIKDIQALTVDTANGFYRTNWWDKYGFGRINAQAVATKIFDTAVNLGTPKAVKITQQAVNAVLGALVATDGVLGNQTLAAINNAPSIALLMAMQTLQGVYYHELANNNPKLVGFLPGWMNRAFDKN